MSRRKWGQLEEDGYIDGIVGVEEDDDLRTLADVLLLELSNANEKEYISMTALYELMTERYEEVSYEDFEHELRVLCRKLHLPLVDSIPLDHIALQEMFDTLQESDSGTVTVADVMNAVREMGASVDERDIAIALLSSPDEQKPYGYASQTSIGSDIQRQSGAQGESRVTSRPKQSHAEKGLRIFTSQPYYDHTLNWPQFQELMRHLPVICPRQLHDDLVNAMSLEAASASPTTMWMMLPSGKKWPFFVAGGVGGLAAKLVMAPLDRVKIVAQTTTTKASMNTLATKIIQEEGWRGFYRGSLASSLRIIPFSAVVCGVYTIALENRPMGSPLLPNEPVWRLIAGGVAGAAATLVSFPLDVARARMSILTRDGRYGDLPLREVLRNMVRHPGTAVYGLKPALCALAPFIAIQQASYDVMKFTALTVTPPSIPLFLACGALAGATAQTIIYPLDLIRRRMQVQDPWSVIALRDKGHMREGYTSVSHAFRSIVRREGFLALYRGIVPSTLKIAPSIAITLLVRDAVLGRLSNPERQVSTNE